MNPWLVFIGGLCVGAIIGAALAFFIVNVLRDGEA